jgi:ATP adenylyltransferase
MNFGRCAGAGLPEHMHIHIVPRWNGDTNFMSVCSETKVISQSLNELFEQLKKVSRENNLPSL